MKFMNTCSFIISSKKISVWSNVFVECLVYFGELEKSSSSLSSVRLAPLTLEASPNTKKPQRACIESFQHCDTLGFLNTRSFGGTNFIVQRNLVSPSLISRMHY